MRPVLVRVNTPVQVALPAIGIAMAGTDSARNAPQAKPPSKSFVVLVVILFLHLPSSQDFHSGVFDWALVYTQAPPLQRNSRSPLSSFCTSTHRPRHAFSYSGQPAIWPLP